MSDVSRSIRTLQFYFKTLFEKVGVEWSSDNDYEIENAVQAIVDEAVKKSVDTAPL